jgi:phosphopantothenoylcysteine decarboxylase/phosphopantothenate--cysteine ligase
MGFAIAEALAEQSAKVFLISGPVHIDIKHPNIELIKVLSAQEMYEQTLQIFPNTNGAIMSAAVADYSPLLESTKKIKRTNSDLSLQLKPNPDIAASVGEIKKEKQILVGFALETDNELENAQLKLVKKNLDFIVLNSLKEDGAGFGHDTNKITIVDKNNKIEKFELKTKKEVSLDIINKIIEIIA